MLDVRRSFWFSELRRITSYADGIVHGNAWMVVPSLFESRGLPLNLQVESRGRVMENLGPRCFRRILYSETRGLSELEIEGLICAMDKEGSLMFRKMVASPRHAPFRMTFTYRRQ